MGTVYKETFTKPLPAGAKIIVRKGLRLARWRDAKGKTRTAPLTAAGDRITIEAGTYTAKYRDGGRIVCKVATGCRDESAARSILNELEKRAEKVKGGILSVAESAAIDHQQTPLADHVTAYLDHQQAKGITGRQIAEVRRALDRLAADCRFARLPDVSAPALEKWLTGRQVEGMGPRTRNAYRAAAVAFCNWCVETNRLAVNPLARIAKADEKADRRRQRRALTEDELVKLLDVARRRPLLERLTVYKGARKGQQYAKPRPEVRGRLERLGLERALIYKTLALTGLRRGELASLTVGQVVLDADPPFLALDAGDEKNRQGSTLPLRADLAADLRQWLRERAAALQEAASEAPAVTFDPKHLQPGQRNRGDSTGREGQACLRLTRLPADAPLFIVPRGLVRILDRDLRLAGIPKRDERGRTVDVHALRHTFGTLLSKNGVAPRTAQAAMRHSTIDLTMNVYTDPKLLDVAGAMEALPALPLGADPSSTSAAAMMATGTDDSTPSPLVPVLVRNAGKPTTPVSIRDNCARREAPRPRPRKTQETPGNQGFSGLFLQWAIPGTIWEPPACKAGALTN